MTSTTESVLDIFRQINAIPRCSGKEKELSNWLVSWAAEQGLECERDEVLNVVIRVPGRGASADASPVALQGHLDMVCEKTPESSHDFESDPIRTTIEGEWLTARETTLGADNGIAVALALAIAVDQSLTHPPLELVFTVDEETGLTGAQKLSPQWLRAKLLLNLDSEDEGVFTVGCAGGLNSLISMPVAQAAPRASLQWMTVRVSGLQGGHSGVDIHLDRANANVLVARVVSDLRARFGAAVAEFHGGNAHNAIPRDARAVVGFDPSKTQEIEAALTAWQEVASAEYRSTDPDLLIELAEAKTPDRALDDSSAARALDVLLGLPHGVVRMSRDIAGLVETSTNLATVRTTDGKLDIHTSQRSSAESQLEAIAARVASIARLGGGTVRITSKYSPWEPQMDSSLLSRASEAYYGLFGTNPRVEVIHAGLECGVIGSKYPGMEMLSIGPTIKMAHSPDERLHVPSLDRVWEFLVQLLALLK